MKSRIAAACSGGSAPTLIAVTKTVKPPVALALAGHMGEPAQLGENRAEVLNQKRTAFESAGQAARWHFIGHIQRNKARRIIERSDVLHSIDSLRLAKTVARLTGELQRSVEVFVEVNLTGEAEKHGLAPEEVPPVLEELSGCEHLHVAGLMAMGPARGLRTVDEVFGDVAQLAAELESSTPDAFMDGRCLLSMGMSGDLEAAVRHGSSYVRIGSALFAGLSDGGQDLQPSSSQDPSR